MKKQLSFFAPVLVSLLMLVSCSTGGNTSSFRVDTASAPASEIRTIKDSLSWGYGQYLALALQGEYFDTAFNKELLIEAFVYTLKGGRQNLLTDDMARTVAQFANMRYSSIMQHKSEQIASNVDSLQGVYFANLQKSNPNVKRCPMGDYAFYYEVLKPGKGPKAKYAQRIKFDYRSFNLLSNQPIDQTYGNREPIVHVVGNPMFPGLIEAFQLMNAGSIYRFYFPYQLAFGAEGSERLIPPYTPVIYEVELHELFEY